MTKTGIAVKAGKDRKERRTAPKTCRAVGLAKAEGTKSAKIARIQSERPRLSARLALQFPALLADSYLVFFAILARFFRVLP
jgi:hypothetical protein